jgi:hypothetical protein
MYVSIWMNEYLCLSKKKKLKYIIYYVTESYDYIIGDE